MKANTPFPVEKPANTPEIPPPGPPETPEQRWWGVRALCPDGRRRRVTFTGEADTFFTRPARVTYQGATIRGYISTDDFTKEVLFHPTGNNRERIPNYYHRCALCHKGYLDTTTPMPPGEICWDCRPEMRRKIEGVEHQWLMFKDWCEEQNFSPPISEELVRFLKILFSEEYRAASYHQSIRAMLRDLAVDKVLHDCGMAIINAAGSRAKTELIRRFIDAVFDLTLHLRSLPWPIDQQEMHTVIANRAWENRLER